MPRILRVNNSNGQPIGTADSQEGIKRVIDGLGPGRYHLDETSSDPLPSGYTSRRWGIEFNYGDQSVATGRDPWPTQTDDTIGRSLGAGPDKLQHPSPACEGRFAVGGEMIRYSTTRIRSIAAIVAMVLAATALCWLSWRAGSPLWDHLQAETTRQAAQLAKLRFPGNAPKAGPEQRIGMP